MNLLNIKFLIELGVYINNKLYRINKKYLIGFKSPFWIINIFWSFFVLKNIYLLLLNYSLFPYKNKIWIVDDNWSKSGLKKSLNNKSKKNYYMIKKWQYGLLTNYKSNDYFKKKRSFPTFVCFLSVSNNVGSLYEANYLNIPYSFLPMKNQKLELTSHYFVPSNTTESIKFFYVKIIEWINLYLNLKFLNNLISKQQKLIKKQKYNINYFKYSLKKFNIRFLKFKCKYYCRFIKELYLFFYLKYISLFFKYLKNKNKNINRKQFINHIQANKYFNSVRNLFIKIQVTSYNKPIYYF